MLSEAEKDKELQWLAAYVLVSLRSRGYKVIRVSVGPSIRVDG